MVEGEAADRLSISWTSLRIHDECRQRAYLQRTHHRASAGDSRVFFAGRLVDHVMRVWLADPQPGAMPELVTQMIDAEEQEVRSDGRGVVRWRDPQDKAAVADRCREAATRLEPLLTRLVVPFPHKVGHRFKVPVKVPGLDGTPTAVDLTGELDLLVTEPGGRKVWDLKITDDDSYWRRTVGQLIFYDLVVRELYGAHPVRSGLIQPMCRRQTPTFTFRDSDRAQMWVAIAKMATDVWRQDYALAETTRPCFRCDVKHACERFRPAPGTKTVNLLGGSVG